MIQKNLFGSNDKLMTFYDLKFTIQTRVKHRGNCTFVALNQIYEMKIKSLFATAALLIFGAANAQTVVTDTIVMGAGYANQVFYSLQNSSKTANQMGSWHIAHTSNTRDNCIRANHAAGVNVYAYPKGDNSAYTNFDTTGWATWPTFMNDIHKHEVGAFNKTLNKNNPWDFSWGVYDAGSHTVVGDSLYLITLSSAGKVVAFIKFMPIAQYPNGDFTFRYDFVGGTKDFTSIDTIKQSKANNGTYKYFHFTNKQVTLEPTNGKWDLNFTRYYEPAFNGTSFVPYLVVGVESRVGSKIAKIEMVTWDDLKASPLTYHNQAKDTTGGEGYRVDLTRIGSKWKVFNGSSYDMVQDLNYLVESKDSNVYGVQFTGFVGASMGRIILNKSQLLTKVIGSTNNIAKNNQVVIYPVPAQNQLYVKPLENSSIQCISIKSLDGRIIRNASNINSTDVAQLNIGDLTAGQYIVEVKTSNGIQNQIISKN